MNTLILRKAFMLIFSTFALNGWAQDEYIINEDFSGLIISGNTRTCGEWSLSEGCVMGLNVTESNKALRIENIIVNSKKYIGYANTGKLNFSGYVYLTFDYARGANRNTIFNLTIENGGTFNDNTTSKSITVTSGNQRETFNNTNFLIRDVTEQTTIKFSESAVDHTFVIDNVKVTKIPEISLIETTNNESTLTYNLNKTVTVNLARTLTGGIWNTLCLPFDVTMEDMKLALGEGQDIKMRTFNDYADKVMTFTETTTITAGTPFLIKLNTTVVNPTFHAVTVKNTTAQTVTSNGVSFVGTYSPVPLNINGTNLFITKNNTLALPAEGMNIMNGLRAYIVVPENFDSSGARLMMDDGETTAVSELAPSTERAKSEAAYSLKGQRVENGRRGLYVINGKLTLVK